MYTLFIQIVEIQKPLFLKNYTVTIAPRGSVLGSALLPLLSHTLNHHST